MTLNGTFVLLKLVLFILHYLASSFGLRHEKLHVRKISNVNMYIHVINLQNQNSHVLYSFILYFTFGYRMHTQSA